jgi:hypothetical protein
MAAVKCHALAILQAFEEADAQLVGKAVASPTERRGPWRPSGLTISTACESPSKVTLESGPSRPSNSCRVRA